MAIEKRVITEKEKKYRKDNVKSARTSDLLSTNFKMLVTVKSTQVKCKLGMVENDFPIESIVVL